MERKHFILVHGAWHGSWCWHKVKAHLLARGHAVTTPDLPGHFHNQEDFKNVTLARYVAHIEKYVRSSSQPVTLVGHSMAGTVISQIAENIPDKIKRLVYVAAFIPEDHHSLTDEVSKATTPTLDALLTPNIEGAAIHLQISEDLRESFYANCTDDDTAFALSRLQAQPLFPFTDTISISHERFGSVPKLYIQCLCDKAILPQDQHRMAVHAGCTIVTLNTDHSPFFSADKALADLIDS